MTTSIAPRSPTRTSALIDLAVAAALAFVCFSVFWPALDAEFVNYDDDLLFVRNDRFRGFGSEQLRWMWTNRHLGHWQPLTWLSIAVDDAISGRNPSSYHRTNLLLHAFNAALVYFLALRLFVRSCPRWSEPIWPTRLGATCAALLFGVHPLRVESVAWVTERRDVLSTLFLLGALAAHLNAIAVGDPRLRSRAWYAASILLLVLSLLSKAWGVSFVFVLLILDVWPLRRLDVRPSTWLTRGSRRVLVQKLPFAILSVAAVVTTSWAVREFSGIVRPLDQWGLGARVVQALYGLSFYLQKTVWPTDLVALVEMPGHLDVAEPRFLAAYSIVVVLVVIVIVLRRRLPALATAAVVYAIVVAPVLGFAQVGGQLVADRYSYVSCISWAVLGGAGVVWAWHGLRSWGGRCALILSLCGIFAALSVLTWRQTRVWLDSRSLWTHALAAGRQSAVAHLNLGVLDLADGKPEVARDHFVAAVAIRSDLGEAWISLASAYATLGQLENAEQALLEATRWTSPARLAWMRLGRLYRDTMGRLDDAVSAFERAVSDVEAGPRELFTPRAYLELGRTLTQTGDKDRARRMLELAGRYEVTAQEAQTLLQRLD